MLHPITIQILAFCFRGPPDASRPYAHAAEDRQANLLRSKQMDVHTSSEVRSCIVRASVPLSIPCPVKPYDVSNIASGGLWPCCTVAYLSEGRRDSRFEMACLSPGGLFSICPLSRTPVTRRRQSVDDGLDPVACHLEARHETFVWA